MLLIPLFKLISYWWVILQHVAKHIHRCLFVLYKMITITHQIDSIINNSAHLPICARTGFRNENLVKNMRKRAMT